MKISPKYMILLLLTSWMFSCANLYSQTLVKEVELKSVLIINFLHYVKWPPSKPSSSIQVCIYSENPLEDFLEKFARLSTVKRNQPVNILYPEKISDLTNCHVVYVSRSSKKEVDKIIKTAEANSILTISDIEDFARKRGMIEFVSTNNRIEFRINYASTKAANLTMSSLLLELADVVINTEANKKR